MRRSAFSMWMLSLILGLVPAGRGLAAGLPEGSPWRLGAPAEVVASSGRFDPLVGGDGYEIGAEVRYAPRRFGFLPRFVPDVAPVAGVIARDRGSLYLYLGAQADVPLGGPFRSRWMLTGGWAAGLYYRSPEFDLGGPLEFRTSLDLSYRLANGARLGVCLYHLSNGGIYERNPGSESLVLTYRAGVRPARR